VLDMAPVVLDAGGRWREAADAVGEHLQAGSLGADPLGADPSDVEEQLDAIASWITHLGDGRPNLRVITIDGTGYHEAGASDAQQLGCTVAAGIEYLRTLDRRGIAPTAAIARIELRLAATDDQFATIATFRAIRRLWGRVAEAIGAPGVTSPVHAVTSRAMMTAYDPWVNALRSTVACFAAGVAGADAVTVLPHDVLRGPAATELGRRVARNTQSILLLESHLDDVIDPAGGSWYVERFTDELADAAWAWCQEIEAAGGFGAAGSLVAERIAATRAARRHDVDTRRAPLTGLTEFPNINETTPPPVVAADGHRWSDDFEALRRRVDAVTPRPSVFLATIGPASVFTPRVTFARNLFEIAGLLTAQGPVTDDPAEIAAAFAASGAAVACLCSSDAVYGERGAAVADALRSAGGRAVYIAGRPKGMPDMPTIHAGMDVRAALTELLDLLQVP
jgi:methylmalonyl-CoA mutase